MEVPAPQAGTVKSVKVKEGDKVSEGSVVLLLESDEDSESSEEKSQKDESENAEEPVEKDEDEASEKADQSERKKDKSSESKPKKKKSGSGKKSAGGSQTVKVPDIGDFDDVPVIEVLVKDGDVVEKDAPLITLESDKATMEVPAPTAGTVHGLKLKEGDTVSKGDAICELEAGDDAAEGADEADDGEDDASSENCRQE